MELCKRYQEMSEQNIAHLWVLIWKTGSVDPIPEVDPTCSSLYSTGVHPPQLVQGLDRVWWKTYALGSSIQLWEWCLFWLPCIKSYFCRRSKESRNCSLYDVLLQTLSWAYYINFQVNHSFRRFGLVCSKLWMGVEPANPYMYTIIYIIYHKIQKLHSKKRFIIIIIIIIITIVIIIIIIIIISLDILTSSGHG